MNQIKRGPGRPRKERPEVPPAPADDGAPRHTRRLKLIRNAWQPSGKVLAGTIIEVDEFEAERLLMINVAVVV